MMKPLMIGAMALATLATPMAASAQSRHHDRDRDGRYEQWERREDHNRRDDGRYTNRERRNDDRRGYRDQRRDYRNTHWGRGQVLPYDYRSNWYVSDYRRYGYRAPPRGYGYYRTDSGDIVLAAIATGVIISLLSN